MRNVGLGPKFNLPQPFSCLAFIVCYIILYQQKSSKTTQLFHNNHRKWCPINFQPALCSYTRVLHLWILKLLMLYASYRIRYYHLFLNLNESWTSSWYDIIMTWNQFEHDRIGREQIPKKVGEGLEKVWGFKLSQCSFLSLLFLDWISTYATLSWRDNSEILILFLQEKF